MRGLKTLHKYLAGQVLATMLLTVAVFTFIMLLMNVLHDVLPLLFGGHLQIGLVLKAVGLLVPFGVVYALPMGFITATLLVFGRFSADQELTATRAGGISLISLVSPVLLLSLFCCALSAWFNMDLGPRSRVEFTRMRGEVLTQLFSGKIPEGKWIRDIPGYMLITEKNVGGELQNLTIYKLKDETNYLCKIQAANGHLNPNTLVVDLKDVHVIYLGSRGTPILEAKNLSWDLKPEGGTNPVVQKPKVSDMTFLQLRQELREVQQLNFSTGTNLALNLSSLERMELTPTTNATPDETAALLKDAHRAQGEQAEEIRVIMNRQVAFAFACFGFTLVGIPLGIRVHRRETNIGIAIALVLVVIFYAFVMLAESLSSHPELYPHLIVWIPVFLFQAIGGVLLWRANRGV
ncbi:MAG TPA: LptF/LptG family permease [Verrucomicrobiae bacterium]|nr:LptF/LptG family permease [Verrucomicrobiae bacterium]